MELILEFWGANVKVKEDIISRIEIPNKEYIKITKAELFFISVLLYGRKYINLPHADNIFHSDYMSFWSIEYLSS